MFIILFNSIKAT